MSATHRENLYELRRRIVDEAGLGDPTPAVSPAIARLLVELWAELGACVLELELLEHLYGARA